MTVVCKNITSTRADVWLDLFLVVAVFASCISLFVREETFVGTAGRKYLSSPIV